MDYMGKAEQVMIFGVTLHKLQLPSFAPRRFLCSCANSAPLCLSCTAATPGSFLPVGLLLSGCGFSGAWWLQEHPNGQRRLVGSATSCVPTEPAPVCHSTEDKGHPPPLSFPCSLSPAPHLTVLALSSLVLCLK